MPAKKQISKEMILSAALHILKTKGIDSLNVKTLAQELHCSTQPIYLSFDSMAALRLELSSIAVKMFLQELPYKESQKAALYGMPYILFAQKEKKLFQFLFMRQNAFSEMKTALIPIMESSISHLAKRYQINYEEAHYFHDQLWMHTHGIASMIATDFCDWDMDKVAQMIAECESYLSQKYRR